MSGSVISWSLHQASSVLHYGDWRILVDPKPADLLPVTG